MNSNAGKTLIILAAVSVKNKYYSSKFHDIRDYLITFVHLVHGKDDVVILVDAATFPQLEGKVPSNTLITASIEDIWIRDFSPVIPSKQIKFQYSPSYLSRTISKHIDGSFDTWFRDNKLEYQSKSDIILDGGNVVDNTAGTRVIVTGRILRDNPSLTKLTAKETLRDLLGVDEVAIIPELPDDTTGHADGLVMWPTDEKVFLIQSDEPVHSEILAELNTSFPSVEVIVIPNHIPNTRWKHFTSAHNCFVNSIVTDKYIYMPTFNDVHDDEMFELFKSHTDKTVVRIPAEHVAMMGGCVRCLSWQLKNSNNAQIFHD